MNGAENKTFQAWSRTLKSCALLAGSVPVGLAKGEPTQIKFVRTVEIKYSKYAPSLTKLNIKHMRPIVRLNVHDLVLMVVI